MKNTAGTLVKGDGLLRAACGDTLRLWRMRHGQFKQTALSRRAGLPDHAVGRLEHGERPVVPEEILRICQALEVDVHELLADVQKRTLVPLLESLRAAGGSEEAQRAVDLVSDRAGELIASMAELASARAASYETLVEPGEPLRG